MRAAGSIAAVLALVAGGCRALPEIPRGTCGNHVIEAGEDCDGFDRLGWSCRPPGGVGACHLDCSGLPANGWACPSGFACDQAGVCRQPLGDFEEPAPPIAGATLRLANGDFDGDGRTDILSRGSPGHVGLAQLRIDYFDRNGVREDSWVTGQVFGNTLAARLSSGDERDDLLVSQTAFCAMIGEANRTLTPIAYPSYYVQGERTLVTAVLDRRVDRGSALSVLRHVDGQFQLERPSRDPTERLVPVAWLPGEPEALAGEPSSAHLFDDRNRHACEELAIAVKGIPELTLFQLCSRDEDGLHWRDEPIVTRLEFQPVAHPTASPLFADLDGEGHADVLIATDAGTYAAFNDGERIGTLEPYAIFVPQRPELGEEAPIAAGDLSGDGLADLLLPRVLAIAARKDGKIVYDGKHGALQGRWVEGAIVDLSGDGNLDAMAISLNGRGEIQPNVDFFLGTGSDRLNPFVIPSVHGVDRIVPGDYDGDNVSDLAFVMPGNGPNADDQISVAFGNPRGFPNPPLDVAHTRNITQLLAGSDNDEDTTDDLLIVTELGGEAGEADRASTLSILVGTTDRAFFSPILLTTFSTDGKLQEADGFAASAGHFAHPGRLDLVAIGGRDPLPEDLVFELEFSLWILPDFLSGTSSPRKLSWEFGDEIEPILENIDNPALTVSFAAADLDGDILDELVLSAPAPRDDRCFLITAGLEDGASRVGAVSTLEFDEACDFQPALEIRDFDGDGAMDIALLLGKDQSSAVHVFWNDGFGSFSPGNASRLADEQGVRAFTAFRPMRDARLELAYATAESVNLVGVNADRTFSAPRTFGGQAFGFTLLTGITSGDVNGDGAVDLAVADDGALRILKASLSR
jgi:hypothetical protein